MAINVKSMNRLKWLVFCNGPPSMSTCGAAAATAESFDLWTTVKEMVVYPIWGDIIL